VSTENGRSLRLPNRGELKLVGMFVLAFCASFVAAHELLYGGPVYSAREVLIIGVSGATSAGLAYGVGVEAASITDSSPGKVRSTT